MPDARVKRHRLKPVLLGGHFGVELGDGAGDAETPGKDAEGFELVGDDVLIDGVEDGNACLVHFFGLHRKIIEDIAEALNALLAADGAVAGNKQGVFVPGGEGLQGVAPAGHGALFVEAGGIGVAKDEVAGVDDFLIGDADDEVGAGVARIVFDDDGEVAEIEVEGEFGGVEGTIGKTDHGFVGDVKDVADSGEVTLSVLAGDVGLGGLDVLFRACQESGAIAALHGNVIFHDALRNGGMGPKRNTVATIEGIAHGMVEVIVGQQSAGRGILRGFAVSVHLESGAGRGAKAFKEQAGVFPDKETSVANGSETFRGVGDGGVEAVADFADGGIASVGNGSLRDAGIIGDRGGEHGERKGSGESIKHGETGSIREKLPASEWSEGVHEVLQKGMDLVGRASVYQRLKVKS